MYSTNPNYSYSHPMYGKSPPPLQHPVPQHPIPEFTNSPGMQYQQQQTYDPTAYTPQQPNLYSQFGFNDPAAQMGMQFAGSAMAQGSAYVEKNLNRWIDIPALRHYFNVSNTYVIEKLQLLIFPWRHKSWNRLVMRSETGQMEGFKPPREDTNSPDLYIPVMAVVTYVLLCGLTAGLSKKFHPEMLYIAVSTSVAVMFWEIVFTRLGCYFLNIPFEASMLDLLCYYGYKFVGIIVTDIVRLTIGGTLSWAVFGYMSICVVFFLLRSMRYVIIPDASAGPSTMNPQRKRRLWFLLTIASLQIVYMFYLIN